ncbi:MAG TPA: RloB family protein [Tenuifilaceae bacterium]|nr:RloB family protein [Tenuifilaceae bacterium]
MTRKSRNRPTKFRVAIVGEGDTEWYYFSNMKQCERFSYKIEPELPKHSDYKTIIDTARRKRDEGYDLIFCVLDLDRIITNPTEKKGYFAEKAKKKANNGIQFIETMPCIELWFLLHFLDRYSTKIYMDYEQVIKPLKTHIPNYEKTGDFFNSIPIYDFLINKGNFNTAEKFAKKLYKEKEQNNNPFSNFSEIHLLINKLKEL